MYIDLYFQSNEKYLIFKKLAFENFLTQILLFEYCLLYCMIVLFCFVWNPFRYTKCPSKCFSHRLRDSFSNSCCCQHFRVSQKVSFEITKNLLLYRLNSWNAKKNIKQDASLDWHLLCVFASRQTMLSRSFLCYQRIWTDCKKNVATLVHWKPS